MLRDTMSPSRCRQRHTKRLRDLLAAEALGGHSLHGEAFFCATHHVARKILVTTCDLRRMRLCGVDCCHESVMCVGVIHITRRHFPQKEPENDDVHADYGLPIDTTIHRKIESGCHKTWKRRPGSRQPTLYFYLSIPTCMQTETHGRCNMLCPCRRQRHVPRCNYSFFEEKFLTSIFV